MPKKICNVLSVFIFLFLAVIAAAMFVPKIAGFDQYAVLSGSMEPGIKVGAIVYERAFKPEALKEGTVITYKLSEGTLVTHRIVSIDWKNKTVVTKGDANNTTDAAEVSFDQITGVYVFTIPYLGYISIYAKTPVGIAVICAILIVIILLNFIPEILESETAV